jgi:mannose-6-phosphate isomerase-like protein (cupin superfamily)
VENLAKAWYNTDRRVRGLIMPLRVVNVAEEAARLTEPFSFVQEGVVELGTEGETVSVRAGEMTVVPKGMVHRLTPDDRAVVMLLERQEPTSGGR